MLDVLQMSVLLCVLSIVLSVLCGKNQSELSIHLIVSSLEPWRIPLVVLHGLPIVPQITMMKRQ